MRLGLIVNPIAGVGGALALKGSDGALAARALASGAVPTAGDRAAVALSGVASGAVTIVTSGGSMGEDAARRASQRAQVVHRADGPTTERDTIAAARAVIAQGVDLLLFAGGDGTARDLLAAQALMPAESVPPVLGIPAGVKMLSSVFATSPRSASALIADWSGRGIPPAHMAEVLDRDADAGIRLYGVLPVPRASMIQAAKAARDGAPGAGLRAAAEAKAGELRTTPLAFVGPGSTMMMVKQALAGKGTLLGVDAYAYGDPVAVDADAATLLALSTGTRPRIVLGIVGGQGFLLGRGNQQLAPAILEQAGTDYIDVLADADKLAGIPAGELLVDSGDGNVDNILSGYILVTTGVRRRMMMSVRAA